MVRVRVRIRDTVRVRARIGVRYMVKCLFDGLLASF